MDSILKLIRRKVVDELFVIMIARLLKAGVIVNEWGTGEDTTKGSPITTSVRTLGCMAPVYPAVSG